MLHVQDRLGARYFSPCLGLQNLRLGIHMQITILLIFINVRAACLDHHEATLHGGCAASDCCAMKAKKSLKGSDKWK